MRQTMIITLTVPRGRKVKDCFEVTRVFPSSAPVKGDIIKFGEIEFEIIDREYLEEPGGLSYQLVITGVNRDRSNYDKLEIVWK